jgi:class 3 adenylate cyclase
MLKPILQMKRVVYLSRFARELTANELQEIGRTARRRNAERGITGFLVCLDGIFFQLLEGPEPAVHELYFSKIIKDPRHTDIVCLRNESVDARPQFPDWAMNVFDLNDPESKLPVAFREMSGILMSALYSLRVYSQPTVIRLLEQGINPARVQPVRKPVTVLFTDLLGFTSLSERLAPDIALGIVNRHFETCVEVVARHGGEVNKLIGDGLLAYFPQPTTTAALAAAREIIVALRERRAAASPDSADRLLFAGVGLSYGEVTEGNVGTQAKREFTIMGRAVNEAARVEGLTRRLKTPVVLTRPVADRAGKEIPLRPLGRQPIKGLAEGLELFGFADLEPLDPEMIYAEINTSHFHRS